MDTSLPSNLPDDVKKEIRKTSLRYVNDTKPGIKRLKNGEDFIYINPQKEKISDKDTLQRIDDLKIPPAWEKVWISPHEFGHIQATGRDEKGRKQYIYHEEWNKIMQENKFHKIISFAKLLPNLRDEIKAGMNEKGLSKRQVLATIVWILEHTYIRIGNPEYAKENQSYGLTTLRNKHVDVTGDTVSFEFKGKSGKMHDIEIQNPKVARIIRKLEEIPGYELFHYIDQDGSKKLIYSEDVNEYLQHITGEEITAKDFRTWGGTVYASKSLYEIGPFTSKTHAKKNISQAVKKVSQHLRNTTTVCRTYYIHPTVIKTYEENILIPHFEEYTKKNTPSGLTSEEHATTSLLLQYAA